MGVLDSSTRRRRSLHLECLESRNLLNASGLVSAAEVRRAAVSGTETLRLHATGSFVNTPIPGVPGFFITTVTGQTPIKGFGLVQGAGRNVTVIRAVNNRATITAVLGSGVLVDANKDQLLFNYSGTGPFTSATKFKATGGGVVTGGTGALAGATGSFTATGTGNLATGTFSVNVVLRVKI